MSRDRASTDRRRVLRAAGSLVLLLVVAASLAYATWFRLGGGHWERVESPSMGTTAPVGTLVWTRPVEPDELAVGDVVSFHRPGTGPDGPVYTHRIRALVAGGFQTAGDLSGPDQWTVADDDVVGRVVHVWPGVGWLVEAGPLLLLGAFLTLTIRSVVRQRSRLSVTMLLGVGTVVVAIVVYRPLTNTEQLGFTPEGDGARASYVSTGMLPLRVTAPGARSVVLGPGEAGSVLTTIPHDGSFHVRVAPDLSGWFWAALAAGCFVPALITSGRRQRPQRRHAAD